MCCSYTLRFHFGVTLIGSRNSHETKTQSSWRNKLAGVLLYAGQTAARLMASEGRQIAEGLPPAKRAEMLQLCDEVDMLTDQLGSLCKKGLVGCCITITVFVLLNEHDNFFILSLPTQNLLFINPPHWRLFLPYFHRL